jgi:hypothetical protein
MLPLGESLKCGQEDRHIVLLLPFDDRRWMLARGGQVDAVVRALNFGEPFCAATDRADGLMQSRTRAAWLTGVAERTGHLVSLDYNFARFLPEILQEHPLHHGRCESDRCREEHGRRACST